MASATSFVLIEPDSITTLVSALTPRIRAMALSPLSRGNDMSSRQASGWCLRAAATASSGSSAVATTVCPSWVSAMLSASTSGL